MLSCRNVERFGEHVKYIFRCNARAYLLVYIYIEDGFAMDTAIGTVSLHQDLNLIHGTVSLHQDLNSHMDKVPIC